MKRFRFSLETVLEVRRKVEEARTLELARARAERDRLAARLAGLEADVSGLLRRQSEARGAVLDLAIEAWYADRWIALTLAIAAAKRALAEKEAAFEAARVRAVEASRDRLALEKLEERQRQEHALAGQREEQGSLDDRAQRAASVFSLA